MSRDGAPTHDSGTITAEHDVSLSAADIRAFRLIAQVAELSMAELADRWDRADDLALSVGALQRFGLVTTTTHGDRTVLRATDPAVTLQARVSAQETALRESRARLLERVAAKRHLLAAESAPALEAVPDRDTALRRSAQLVDTSRAEVRRLGALPLWVATGLPPATRRPGVVIRTIVDRDAIEQRSVFAEVENLLSQGDEVRTLPTLPAELCLIDRVQALLPLTPDAGAWNGMLIVSYPAIVDAMAALFDVLWRRAVPLRSSPASDTRPGHSRRGRVNRDRLIALMLTGLTDEAIARQLGVGYRTVQDHVARLLTGLGVHSRFQAGVQVAIEHGRPRSAADQ